MAFPRRRKFYVKSPLINIFFFTNLASVFPAARPPVDQRPCYKIIISLSDMDFNMFVSLQYFGLEIQAPNLCKTLVPSGR